MFQTPGHSQIDVSRKRINEEMVAYMVWPIPGNLDLGSPGSQIDVFSKRINEEMVVPGPGKILEIWIWWPGLPI